MEHTISVQKFGGQVKVTETKIWDPPYPLYILERLHMTKREAAEHMNLDKRFRSFDYALPQGWLDEFFEYAKRFNARITYDLILGTTFWCYPEGATFGIPVTISHEVFKALQAGHYATV